MAQWRQPSSASCAVTPTTAPVSRSTACSALCARCARPSFIFVIFASGSRGCVHSSFEPFFLRLRSSRDRSARVASNEAPQRGVRFQRRRVDADRLAFNEAGRAEALQHPRRHGPMGFEIDQTPRPRNRRVVGRRLPQTHAQKIPQGQRIRRAPRDATLRVTAFEVTVQQQAE